MVSRSGKRNGLWRSPHNSDRRSRLAGVALITSALCVGGCGAVVRDSVVRSYMGVPFDASSTSPEVSKLARRAVSGDKQAQFDLGLAFEEGHDVERDIKKARKLYQLAAGDTCGALTIYQPGVGTAPGKVVQLPPPSCIKGLEIAKAKLAELNIPQHQMREALEMPVQDQPHPREFLLRGSPKAIIPKAFSLLLGRDLDPNMVEQSLRSLEQGEPEEAYTFISTQRFTCPTAVDDVPSALWREHCLPDRYYIRVLMGGQPLTAERRALLDDLSGGEIETYRDDGLREALAKFELSSADWTNDYAIGTYRHFPYPYSVRAMYGKDKLLLIKGPIAREAEDKPIYSVALFLFFRT